MAEAKAVNGEEEQVHIRNYNTFENLDPKVKNVNIKYCPLPGIYDIFMYIGYLVI